MNKLSAIPAALDLLLLSGIFLLFGPSVKSLAQEKASQRKLRSLAQAAAGFRRPDRPSLSDILALAVGLKGSHAEALFVGLSTVLALAAGLLLFAAYGPGTGLLGFLCAGLAPYLLVRTRLQNKQVDVSREGEQLLTELLNNYRICRFNMREAVERTALSIEEAPL